MRQPYRIRRTYTHGRNRFYVEVKVLKLFWCTMGSYFGYDTYKEAAQAVENLRMASDEIVEEGRL